MVCLPKETAASFAPGSKESKKREVDFGFVHSIPRDFEWGLAKIWRNPEKTETILHLFPRSPDHGAALLKTGKKPPVLPSGLLLEKREKRRKRKERVMFYNPKRLGETLLFLDCKDSIQNKNNGILKKRFLICISFVCNL